MGRYCFGPGCNNGNPSVEKVRVGPKPTYHAFPEDDDKRLEWVRKTPKTPKEVTLQNSKGKYLCGLHFHPSSYRTEKSDQRNARGAEQKKKILLPDALPVVWPGLAEYLSSPESKPRPTTLSTSEKRIEAEIQRKEEEERKSTINFVSLSHFETVVKEKLGRDFSIVKQGGNIGVFRIDLSEDPTIENHMKSRSLRT